MLAISRHPKTTRCSCLLGMLFSLPGDDGARIARIAFEFLEFSQEFIHPFIAGIFKEAIVDLQAGSAGAGSQAFPSDKGKFAIGGGFTELDAQLILQVLDELLGPAKIARDGAAHF